MSIEYYIFIPQVRVELGKFDMAYPYGTMHWVGIKYMYNWIQLVNGIYIHK